MLRILIKPKEIVVFVNDSVEPGIERIWHHFQPGFDASHNQVDIVASASFRAHSIGIWTTGQDDGKKEDQVNFQSHFSFLDFFFVVHPWKKIRRD